MEAPPGSVDFESTQETPLGGPQPPRVATYACYPPRPEGLGWERRCATHPLGKPERERVPGVGLEPTYTCLWNRRLDPAGLPGVKIAGPRIERGDSLGMNQMSLPCSIPAQESQTTLSASLLHVLLQYSLPC